MPEEFQYDGTQLYSKTLYKYDEVGKLIEENSYSYVYESESKSIIEDNPKPFLKATYQYNSSGILIYKRDKKNTSYKFDEGGNIIEQKKDDGPYASNFRKFYSYDIRNQLIEKKWRSHQSIGFTETYLTGNDNGENIGMSEMTKWSQRIEDIKYTYRYNKFGEILEIIKRSDEIEKGAILKTNEIIMGYKYEYDQVGNWIKKYGYENGILTQVTIRNIEYHPK